ncbi:MAG: DUF2202 domain-containing protein [Fusobacteriaceae bacterium]|nr:DUF2202 domain-containing protein [Fusobacteriaceae bacterium]
MKRFITLFLLTMINFGIFAITDKQKSDLLFMYQEEKLARDVYTVLSKEHTLPVFSNIAKSEANHMAQVETLLNKYKIKVPNLKEGEFIDKDLQNLYKKLVVEGKYSLKSALNVGIVIEEKDIADLKEKINNTPEDIQFVYQNLLKASENHRKAFDKF